MGTTTDNRGATTELTGWVLVLVGTLLAIVSGRQVANIFTADDAWSETSATVIRTRVTEAKGDSARESRVYQEIVYFVKGNRYQESIEIGRFDSRDEAATFVAGADRSGSVVTVWVQSGNPSHVQKTPIEQNASIGGTVLFALLGLVSLQIGGGLIVAAHRKGTSPNVSGVPGTPVPSV